MPGGRGEARAAKRAKKKDPRSNVAPQSPRFMPSSKMTGTGTMPSPPPSEEAGRGRRPKVKNLGKGKGACAVKRKKKGRTPASCRS